MNRRVRRYTEESKQKVIWKPQLKQALFMSRPEYECLYGGAAGGGKSDALLCEALRQVHIPNYRGIIFRRTYPQLEGLITRSHELYKRAFPLATYNTSDKVWKFKSGARIFFGYMQYEKDWVNYQGKAYDFVGFDELTHFTYKQYMNLMGRNRPTGSGTRVYIRATANPGGVGHGWVKNRFIDAAPAKTPIKSEYEVISPTGIIKLLRKRIYIPATVFDNKKLLENDPNYLANLAALPEAEKNAMLYGDWNTFVGKVFKEFVDAPEHYVDQKWTHVIEPFAVPAHWRILRGFDFGYAKPFSVGWYAVDEKGKIYRIREYYGCTGEPNHGLMIDPVRIAKKIKEIENEDPMLKGKTIIGTADPSIFDESRGESIAQLMAMHPNYVYWGPGDNTRLAGKMQYHYRLAFDEEGECMFQVFNTCKHFIRTFPALVYSASNVEDIDTDGEDHIYDECRYVLMEHPISPRENARVRMMANDPLELFDIKNNRHYKM
ncbi:MAG: Terminase-like family protein [Lachnospiraceae bacterium]|nr:Terminase-like family protein [Lachnospiraceae bacterium]